MQDLQSFCEAQFPRATASRAVVNNLRTALRHLDRFLERSPQIQDLNSRTVTALLQMLEVAGRRPETVRRVRTSFARLSRAAANAGLAEPLSLPTIDLQRRQPFSVIELNQMFGSARTMPGEVCGVPAGDWWTALLLIILNARVPAPVAIDLPASAFNPHTGTLNTGLEIRELRQETIDALQRIRQPKAAKLLPFDRRIQILYRRMKLLQYRAGIPHVARNLFERLRYTGRREPSILNAIDLKARFSPKPGRPKLLRARDRRRARLKNIPAPPADGIYRLAIDSPRTLRRFFEDVYLPHRLADATEWTAKDHRTAIDKLSWFCGFDCTVDALSEELLDAFLSTLKRTERYSNATLNHHFRAPLLALWRHAWRKHLAKDQPRDVLKFRIPKRLPEAWTIDELSRILATAARTKGRVAGVPAGKWWTALLLTLYDTGLRINALLSLPAAQFDQTAGWIVVPAELQKQDAEQAFQLHADTVAALNATGPQTRQLLFPCTWTNAQLYTEYRDILQRAGLPHGRRDMFHKLRRTSGTAVAAAIDLQAAQKHLGHSSASLTSRSYVDPRHLRRDGSIADRIERPRWKGGRK